MCGLCEAVNSAVPSRELGSEAGILARGRTYNLHKLPEMYGKGAAPFFRPARNGKAGLACIGANREDEMPSFSDVKYVYDPEALKIMAAAFDTVCQVFPPDLKEHEGARRRLALLILRHMDRGEHEVARLSDLALLDFMRPLALEQR